MIPSVFNDHSPSLLSYALLGVQDGLHPQMEVYMGHAKMRESMICQVEAVSIHSLVDVVEVCLLNFLQPIDLESFFQLRLWGIE